MKNNNETKKLSYSDYLKLKGLEVLAKHHNKELNYIEKATLDILLKRKTDAEEHVMDFVSGYRELDDMLEILKIEVEKK